jgi:hypothetical protein
MVQDDIVDRHSRLFGWAPTGSYDDTKLSTHTEHGAIADSPKRAMFLSALKRSSFGAATCASTKIIVFDQARKEKPSLCAWNAATYTWPPAPNRKATPPLSNPMLIRVIHHKIWVCKHAPTRFTRRPTQTPTRGQMPPLSKRAPRVRDVARAICAMLFGAANRARGPLISIQSLTKPTPASLNGPPPPTHTSPFLHILQGSLIA